MTHQRSNERKSVGLLVKLTYSGVDEFAQRYATNLSDGGMFVRTREPRPVGTELHFKVEIASGLRVLQGLAVVRWTRAVGDPSGPPGMGLQFRSLDEASRVLVARMLQGSAPPAAAPPPAAPDDPFGQFGSEPPRPPSIAPVPASAIAPPPPSIAPALPAAVPSPPTPAAAPALPEIEIDLDALIAGVPQTPAEPPPPFESTPSSGFDIDLDLAAVPEEAVPEATPAAQPTAVAPPTPVAQAQAPVAQPPRAATQVPAPVAHSHTPVAQPTTPIAQPTTPGSKSSTPIAQPAAPPASASQPPPPPTALPEIRRGPAVAPPQGPHAPAVLTEARAEPPPPPPPPPGARTAFLVDEGPPAETGPVIGIDLGTTNSACAILRKGRPTILDSKDGYNTIPSIVALSKTGAIEVGRRAKTQLVLNPKLAVFGAKRLVGREFDSPTVALVRERSHFEIVADEKNRPAVRLGRHTLSLEEVQALVLKECREMAEHSLGTKVSRAVVTCPAYYSEAQREAVRRAGRLAGLKVERVLNEPTAAALAFGMSRELSRTVLVYDLGGGTFDATLLKIDKSVFEVLATGGDVFLGGVDFDNQLVDLLIERFEQQHGRPFQGNEVALARVSEAAEKAKMSLSEQTSYEVHLPMLDMDLRGQWFELKCTVTRAELEKVCGALIDRTIHAVQDVLLDAKLKPSQVDDILLVGGMSRMPLVRERLKALFKKPAHASVNADEAVALGAAVYSGSVDKVSSLVLIDVVPMTVGLGKPGGGFHRLIERNTPLPVTKTFGLSTFKDHQTELEVLVFQGEDNNVSGNEFLGAVKIDGLPKAPKGVVQVAITLTLDAECVLHVEAKEFKTRKAVKATLASRYTTAEVAQRLGISAEKQAQATEQRGAELTQRAGGFWSRLKRVFTKA
ncbi:MAG: TIGR02266 family protein [Myxococcaceae bacterium]|nr:TIGR02266 family protein [Myxococcaceae bacterium]